MANLNIWYAGPRASWRSEPSANYALPLTIAGESGSLARTFVACDQKASIGNRTHPAFNIRPIATLTPPAE